GCRLAAREDGERRQQEGRQGPGCAHGAYEDHVAGRRVTRLHGAAETRAKREKTRWIALGPLLPRPLARFRVPIADRPMPRRARTAPRREPLQKRAEDTVDVLLRATEIALGKHGFHATTTNKIAEIAGVSIGTLYHYFPTKEALVQAIVERQWRAELAVVTALHLVRTASRDYADKLADGTLAEEVAQMLSRYLMKDPPP